MYLAHITELKYIKNILEDGELKSNKLTNNIESGKGIYNTHNNFVYFVTTDKLFDKKIYGSVILYINNENYKNNNSWRWMVWMSYCVHFKG